MHTITTIGLDIAKSVFQVHGIDAEDKVIIRRQLKRRYVYLDGSMALSDPGQ
jgi:transposase